MKRRRNKPLDPAVGASLGPTHVADIRKYYNQLFKYLRRTKQDDLDYWKAIGCLRGIHNKLALLDAMVLSEGYRLPPKRSRKKKVPEEQLALTFDKEPHGHL
jgi:hypothetical protein